MHTHTQTTHHTNNPGHGSDSIAQTILTVCCKLNYSALSGQVIYLPTSLTVTNCMAVQGFTEMDTRVRLEVRLNRNKESLLYLILPIEEVALMH